MFKLYGSMCHTINIVQFYVPSPVLKSIVILPTYLEQHEQNLIQTQISIAYIPLFLVWVCNR